MQKSRISLAEEIHGIIKSKSYSGHCQISLHMILKGLTKDEKRLVVNELVNEMSALFHACVLGLGSCVNYLLDECCADIEKSSIFIVKEDKGRHKVTPLWAAAVSDHLEVVKILLRKGANVNALSDTGSTPVRSACYMTNLEVVRTLIENGADIHIANKNGGTCLINAVQSFELCKILVKNGANINTQDMSGNVALHYAVKEGREQTVKFLLDSGANVYIKNENGDDIIRTAALRAQPEILNIIAKKSDIDTIDFVNALDVLGASLIDENHDIPAALKYWKKSLQLRIKKSLPFVVSDIPITDYNNATGIKSLNELEDIAASPDKIYMQSLLLRELILGGSHRDTLFGLMYRGAVYADNQEYEQCVKIWMRGLRLRHKVKNSQCECGFALQALTKLFWELEFRNQEEDLLDVINITISLILEPSTGSKDSYSNLMELLVHQLILAKEETLNSLKNKVINLKHRNGLTLMHCVINPKSSFVGDEYFSDLPNFKLLNFLIQNGANCNVIYEGKTPYQSIVKLFDFPYKSYFQEKKQHLIDAIKILLETGNVHFDVACEKNGKNCDEILRVHTKGDILPMKYLTLRCLAAKIVKTFVHKLPRNEIPHNLLHFVKMH